MYIADLHIHSNYSRATSRQCVPEYLELWSRRKGIDLLGTGDFTHPAWRAELKEKLVPAEEGLYVLREEDRLEEAGAEGKKPRFVITGEISSIYKKNDKVRKVHNLILLPSLEAAETLSRRLEAIGNIHSDGRPILGLDSRDLLEITLEACPEAVFIPAHIWTPHFSMFGAFSGFDTIEECFGDLTPHIHALETGLSSDPAMNWRLSALDSYTLVSNSDAHSPQKLGREANLLDTGLTYPALKRALEEGKEGGFRGTIEFFPEEGKYHFDGHRNCHLCLKPAETIQLGGRCPACGKKITIGVQHRVEELADRVEGYCPPEALPFESLAPLPEVIAASTGLAAGGKKAAERYETLLSRLGSEFYILRQAPLEDIRREGGICVAEGIKRLREGKVERIPGFDGQYGVIRLLDEAEIKSLGGQMAFLSLADLSKQDSVEPQASFDIPACQRPEHREEAEEKAADDLLGSLNPQQLEAVTAPQPAVAVIAGPGSGKTKTLVSKIAYLVERRGVKPGEITAVTFTNKAADEMRQRLQVQLGGKRAVRGMTIGTFHAVCLGLLTEAGGARTLAGENEALELAEEVVQEQGIQLTPLDFLREVSKQKNRIETDRISEAAANAYQERLERAGVMDLDDLLLRTLELCQEEKKAARLSKRFTYLLVDEFQDINEVQYELIRAWSKKSKGLFVIGDPDQAIYGFRGSKPGCFRDLEADEPELRTIHLVQNYRSTPEILNSALRVIEANDGERRLLSAQRPSGEPVRLLTAQSDLSEGIYVAKQINQLVGGIDMLDAYGFARPKEERRPRSFSEIAVLYRTHRQGRILEKCLRQEGIPFSVVGRDGLLADRTVRGAVALFRFWLDPRDLFSLRTALKSLCGADNLLCDRAAETLSGCDGPEEALGKLEGLQNEPLLLAFTGWCRDFMPLIRREKPVRLIEAWAQACGLEESEVIQKMMNLAVFHPSMEEFLSTLVLGQEADVSRSSGRSYQSDAVTLMTLHGCKGLEFPVVFLCGVKAGSIPLESKRYPTHIEEERRLFYVGMTRAQEELYLLASPEPSPFLDELPCEYVVKADASPPKKQVAEQLTMFDL